VDKYRFTVAAGESKHLQPYSNEELKFLTGDGAPEITAFRREIGLWDNFSVSRGMDGKAWTSKARKSLLPSTSALRHLLESQSELFANSYKLRCPSSLSRGSSRCRAVLASGEAGVLNARHAGQLYLECEAPSTRIIDMRNAVDFENEQGHGRIYRKGNFLRWTEFLATLEQFLEESSVVEVSIRHDYARDEA
jgi:hypothetical protein